MIETYSNIVAKYIEPTDRDGYFEALKLRYHVYCEEKNFIDSHATGTDQQIEVDEYDEDRSWHFLVLNTSVSGEEHAIGTVRLVRYSDDKGFPTGKFYPPLYEKITNHGIPVNEMAEISRLCINPCFRRRRDDGLYGIGSYSTNDVRRKYPIVLLSLLREMYQFSKKIGIHFWLSSMEDSLYRYLKCISLEFEPLDEDYIDYYGKVKSFVLGIEQAEEQMEQKQKDLFLYFTNSTEG